MCSGSTKRSTLLLNSMIKFCPSDANLPFVLERDQFPIRLSFSITINKSQGQTFEKVALFLREPVFSHGQLYVALSRARSLLDVKMKIIDNNSQIRRYDKCITKNIVFKDVLS